MAPDLLNLLGNGLAPVEVVIQFNGVPGLGEVLKLTGLGGVIHAQYTIIPAITVELPEAVIPILALDPNIAYISPNRAVAPTLDLTTAAVEADVDVRRRLHGRGRGSGDHRQRDLSASGSGVAHRIPAEFRWRRESGRLRARNACGGDRGRQRGGVDGAAIHAHVPGRGAGSEPDRFAGAGRQRDELGQHRAGGDRPRGGAEAAISHRGNQSVAGAADLRELPAGPDLPGGGGGMEAGHRGGGGGGKSGPRRLRDDHFAGQQSVGDYGWGDEDGGNAADRSTTRSPATARAVRRGSITR